MNSQTGNKSFKRVLLASAIAVGITGYGLGSSNLLSVTPSYAEAVSVEAPAAFSFADVVEAVSPAVVSVRVQAGFAPARDEGGFDFERRGREFFEEFFGERGREFFRERRGQRGPEGRSPRRGPRFGQSQGSGFFVSGDGYVVTNNHVIEGGSKFTVVTSQGEELEAELIGSDPRTDLAVLKVDEQQDEFTYVDFGNDRPRIGEWVVAVGNPFGLGGTVTAGIVSAHGREIGASRFDDFIQIDAAVNKGNSGGPAFNLKGEVIGVNTAIFSPSGGNVGIAFAIPAALADDIVTDLIENGTVTRGWLGVRIQPVTEEMGEALGLDIAKGAIITSVEDGSPAADANLQSGDIITQVDAKAIKNPRELSKAIAGYDPKSTVSVTLWRDGETQKVDVTLGELEQTASADNSRQTPKAKPTRMKRLGVMVEPSGDGLRVVEVKPGSRAAKRGIREGDVIAEVNGKEISTLDELRDGLDAAREAGRKGALLHLKRGDASVFVPVPVQRG